MIFSSHDVEEERVCVVVERLVVEEELGEEAEVLRVRLVLAAVDLEEGNLWRIQLIKQVWRVLIGLNMIYTLSMVCIGQQLG